MKTTLPKRVIFNALFEIKYVWITLLLLSFAFLRNSFAQETMYHSGDTTFIETESETYFLLNDTVYIVVDGIQQVVRSLSSLQEQKEEQVTNKVQPDTTFVNVEGIYEDPNNPDGVQGSDEAVQVEPLAFPEPEKSIVMLKSAKLPSLKSASATDPVWDEEGAVNIVKSAQTTLTTNRWKINVKVEGKNIKDSTDVVIVIDDSGSMSGNRIESARNAAKEFVDQLIPVSGSGDIRIAIVTINSPGNSGYPQLDHVLSANTASLKNAIDQIGASGGTNIQGGFYRARQVLANSTVDNKFVVLLSDGDPTYSYEFDSDMLSTVSVNLESCDNDNPVWSPGSLNANQLYFDNSTIDVDYGTRVGGGSNYTYSGNWSFSTTQSCSYTTYVNGDCIDWGLFHLWCNEYEQIQTTITENYTFF